MIIMWLYYLLYLLYSYYINYYIFIMIIGHIYNNNIIYLFISFFLYHEPASKINISKKLTFLFTLATN